MAYGATWKASRETGLTIEQPGRALSLGLVVDLVGAGIASALGLRLGRALPLVIGALAQLAVLHFLLRLRQFENTVLAFEFRASANSCG